MNSSKGPGLASQHPYGCSQLFVPGDPRPTFGLLQHKVQSDRYTFRHSYIHKIETNKYKKEAFKEVGHFSF